MRCALDRHLRLSFTTKNAKVTKAGASIIFRVARLASIACFNPGASPQTFGTSSRPFQPVTHVPEHLLPLPRPKEKQAAPVSDVIVGELRFQNPWQ